MQSPASGRATLTVLESRAVELHDPTSLMERVARSMPLTAFLEGPQQQGFFHRSGVVSVGDVAVSCSVHSPLEIGFDDCPFATLVLPLAGVAQVRIEGQRLALEGGPMAAYLPGAAFTASTGPLEDVLICLDRQRLAETASALGGFGRSARSYRPRFESTLLVDGSLPCGQADLLCHLHLALRLMEAPLLCSAGGLQSAPLEDLLYRLVAALICPELLSAADATVPGPSPDRHFDELLEWIQAHLHIPITPTELSRRSSYSPRNLQYRFQQRFGCSPMQWVKQQRLLAVRRDLERGQPGDTVAAIARRHGFTHLSSFAACFAQSYGVLPSALLRCSLSQGDCD